MTSSASPVFWSDDKYEIRPAKNNDEYRALWWKFMQELGWNRGYSDLDTYMNYSKGYGMILLVEKATGKAVGHVASVINENSTGWVAMFIIDAEHRGKGYGRPLFEASAADFERHGVKYIGLDGVLEQQGTYERRRFVKSSLGDIEMFMRPLLVKEPLNVSTGSDIIIDLRKVPQKLLVQHDLKYTGFERPGLWSDQHLFHRKDVEGVAVVSREDPQTVDDIRAWAMNRRCVGGIRVGPVYAADAKSAKAAIVAAMAKATPEAIISNPLPNINDGSREKIVQDGTMVTEIWGANSEAKKLFEELGWKPAPVDEYWFNRMWVDDKATPQQQDKDGIAQKGVFAIFDAAVG